jgi:dCMP deaminase
MTWDEYFMTMADLVASKSKDRSSKIGCVIVGPNHEVRSTGYNGMCRGVNDDIDERHDRPEKLFWFEHAERNALYNAARNGIRTEGCTAYIAGKHPPCADCTRGLIQSGISRVIIRSTVLDDNTMWVDSFKRSKVMFEESGVELQLYG